MLTFNQFLKKYNLKNKSTSNIEINKVNPSVEIVTKSQLIKTNKTIINLDDEKGTHWTLLVAKQYFDPFGIGPPRGIECDLYSSYKIQKMDESYCAAYCLYIVYLMESGITFKQAILNLYFQRYRN